MESSSEHNGAHTRTDVLIIGGGPGGSATAIQCARAGLSITLLERDEFPRAHPGETLHPGVEPLLKQLGVLEEVLAGEFLRHEGNWISWGDCSTRFEAFGEDGDGRWRGYQAWRADFDNILLKRARDLGVRIIQPCRAERPLLDGARVCGAETSAGNITAAFVVDAAGNHHWLARQLGLYIERRSARLIARYGYVKGECPERDEAPSIVADSNGWTWTARVKPDMYQWTHLSLSIRPDKKSLQMPPAELRHLEPCGRARGADVTWRAVKHPAGRGYFLIGDAAAVLDPASSHGVLKAIMTGMMAAHSITRIINQEDEHIITEAYCRWIHDWFEHDVSKLKKLYAIFKQPASKERREGRPRRAF